MQKELKILRNLPELVEKTLLTVKIKFKLLAKDFLSKAKGAMFLGRGSSYPIALEGALKLKELSYTYMLKVIQLVK